jgi:hypothetical protein
MQKTPLERAVMLGKLLSGSLHPQQVTAIIIVSISAMSLLIFLMTAIIASAAQKVSTLKLETALKRDMIERGMSAAAIAQVVNSTAAPETASNLPCASEAVVSKDGEWHTALVLQMADDRYYVHYVGCEMDENEWVDDDRIRFRNWSKDHDQIADSRIPRNGAPRKPRMEMEV